MSRNVAKTSPVFFVIALSVVLLGRFAAGVSREMDAEKLPLFSFGVIADVQYSAHEAAGTRYYNNSKAKLAECVEFFNGRDLSFVIQLGDFIDKDFESIKDVLPIYNNIRTKKYHLLGNHDFSVGETRRHEIFSTYGLDVPEENTGYYDFSINGWRFIVLNGSEISTYANPESSPNHKKAVKLVENLKKKEAPNAYDWNGGISGRQARWLNDILSDSEEKNQKAVIFCHFPVYPENAHNLLNSGEVLSIIDGHKNVAAYMNGHNHAGHYGVLNGVYYVTFRGMVETDTENAYAVVEVFPGKIKISGYGREESRVLEY